MTLAEKELRPSTVENILKTWSFTEIIAGIGIIGFTSAAGVGFLAIGSGVVKLAIIERSKRSKSNTGR